MSRKVQFDTPNEPTINASIMDCGPWPLISGRRDPNMTLIQRKMVKIMAYLGINVYLKLATDKEKIVNAMLLTAQGHQISVDPPRLQDLDRERLILQKNMGELWLFLLKLPGNFEHLHPDGSKFMDILENIDEFDLPDEVGPIAVVELDTRDNRLPRPGERGGRSMVYRLTICLE